MRQHSLIHAYIVIYIYPHPQHMHTHARTYSDDKEEAARAVAELETGHGEGVKKVSAHALAKQNAFLMEMGIRDLLEMYLSSLDEEKVVYFSNNHV